MLLVELSAGCQLYATSLPSGEKEGKFGQPISVVIGMIDGKDVTGE